MSKRQSTGQKNTLLSYFQSPKAKPTPKKDVEKANPPEDPDYSPKHESQDDSDEEIIKPTKKRTRVLSDNESDSENESPNKPLKKTKLNEFQFKRQNGDEIKSTPNKKNKTDDDDDDDSSEEKPKIKQVESIANENDIHTSWSHNKIEFLKPGKIRDKNKREPHHPDYDQRTLYVPEDFLNKQTPAMRQWWILKRDHFDSVLFFKVGKFYELYHMDAVVGVQHLGFSYMKGEFAHSGFPESAYAKMAGMLIEKGFKVARVEQTETPEMMNERVKLSAKKSKYDKVVSREICQVSTKATTIYSAQMPDAKNSLPCYLFAISEKPLSNGNLRFGVCFVDTSIGTFHLAEFDDDKHFSKLLSLFAEHPPGLILTERGKAKSAFTDVLTYFKDVRKDTLASKSQFYTASTTLEKLSTGCYFKDKEGHFRWPDFFKLVADECIPKPEFEEALKCLGACLWYLKDSEIDIQVFSMGKFEMYDPIAVSKTSKPNRNYMILDSVTIRNLNLLGGKGSLQNTLDHCETAFGKRLLVQWICRPLCDIDKIVLRQEAVAELWNKPEILSSLRDILKNLPDLERQVAKINNYGNKFCATNHPNGRAIFYEAKTYSKRKIQDLLKTLKAFENVQNIPSLFKDCESKLLRKLSQHPKNGMFLNLENTLTFFKEAFDQKEAQTEGKIIPKRGVDEDYDDSEQEIADLHKELDSYLTKQCKKFGCKVTYFGSDKKRFQLDIPDHKTHLVDSDYQLEGTRKGKSKRYHTPETRKFLADMLKAESERAKIILDLNRRIFEKFSQHRDEWDQVIQCLTMLDVLSSLAEYARTFSQDICVPKVKPMEEDQQIIIENGRHPCVLNIDSFVPNDTEMGREDHAKILLLTGPNMGGKSTLMRQVAILTVMAQMGSVVPASFCEINLIDRIFTRIGAHDDIVRGQSTFFVELSEASSILKHATQHSLVLLDELGRGTSTHDGNAIATAYVKKLTEIQCRTIFATHYHTLVDNFIGRKDVQLGHMACMVENDEDPTQESVTFLYKLVEGRCPKSYGFNAARLAGLKHEIIARGRQIAKDLEEESKNRVRFSKLFTTDAISEIRKMIGALKVA